jgi:hypothetical protein
MALTLLTTSYYPSSTLPLPPYINPEDPQPPPPLLPSILSSLLPSSTHASSSFQCHLPPPSRRLSTIAHALVSPSAASPHPPHPSRLSLVSISDSEHLDDAPPRVMSVLPTGPPWTRVLRRSTCRGPGPPVFPLQNKFGKTVNSYHFAIRPLCLMKINPRSVCPGESCS